MNGSAQPQSLRDADARLSRLLSLIVHELRAPAAVVAGYLRLLTKTRAARLSDADRNVIGDAAKCCARLLRVLQEIEDYGGLEPPDHFLQLSPVPVFALCDEAVRETAGSGRQLTFNCSPDDWPALVCGEPHRLKQAFAALAAFSVREHGAVPVEMAGFVARDDGDRAQAVVVCGEEGFANHRAHVLAAASTEFDCWRGGTGLSVPLAERIVERHGGRVWSLPGSHAAMAVSLPLASV